MNSEQNRISIITATFNAVQHLPGLIACLRAQTDRDFEWVVADGASSDGTLEILQSVTDLNIVISSQPDFGIYDALNRAVRLSSGDYYLVLGADDRLFGDSVASFRQSIQAGAPDIVSARVMAGGRPGQSRRHWPWLYGAFAYVNSHAVGTLIRKSLHEQFGFYSRSFPLVADQLFIKRAGDGGARIVAADFIAGEFGMHGCSGTDVLGVLAEGLRVQIATGENKLVQALLFVARMIRNFGRL